MNLAILILFYLEEQHRGVLQSWWNTQSSSLHPQHVGEPLCHCKSQAKLWKYLGCILDWPQQG